MDPLDLATLRRFPDVEAPNLFAHDAADRLLLDEAGPLIDAQLQAPSALDGIVVLGDSHGALTLSISARVAEARRRGDRVGAVRVFQDTITSEHALAANAERAGLSDGHVNLRLGGELLVGARVILLRLPRSLDQLAAWADAVARHAEPDAVLLAAGRIKHMTTRMNDVLLGAFEHLDVSHARQKSRVLRASGPRRDLSDLGDLGDLGEGSTVERVRLDEFGLWNCAVPGVFAGTKLDIGTRFLLETLEADDRVGSLPSGPAIDLGCGTGLLASWVATRRPDRSTGVAEVIATDQSWAAVDSAVATAVANGVADRVRVVRDDVGSTLPTGSAALILCNPPFHSENVVTDAVSRTMLTAAGRLLRPGGELWTVFNSHLSHPSILREAVGPTTVVARNTKFTVTRSRRAAA